MPLNRSILLAGVKHCGKSTLGRLLARRFKVPFRDTDAELLSRHPETQSIRELYLQLGETQFRRAEAEVIGEIAPTPPAIIALGGGAVTNPDVDALKLKEAGFLIALELPDEAVFQRILRRGLPPFLADAADPFAALAELNAGRRKKLRELADAIVGLDPQASPRENLTRLLKACPHPSARPEA